MNDTTSISQFFAWLGCDRTDLPFPSFDGAGYAFAQSSEVTIPEDHILFRGKDGKLKFVDGDTFWIGIHQIRLYGTDAIEPQQTCMGDDGKTLSCGEESRKRLEVIASDGRLACFVLFDKNGDPRMNYSRYVATCYVGDDEINRQLVSEGMALAVNTRDGEKYKGLQTEAETRKVGIHKTKFEKPWDFRRQGRSDGECDND